MGNGNFSPESGILNHFKELTPKTFEMDFDQNKKGTLDFPKLPPTPTTNITVRKIQEC